MQSSPTKTHGIARALWLLASVLLLAGTCKLAVPSKDSSVLMPLVPLPASVLIDGDTHYDLGPHIIICADHQFESEAGDLKTWLELQPDLAVTVRVGSPPHSPSSEKGAASNAGTSVILIRTPPQGKLPLGNAEAYDLSIGARVYSGAFSAGTSLGVRIEAMDSAGAFYAIKTLMQIIATSPLAPGGARLLPVSHIIDSPRFAWRGSMIDCSRHFIPVEYLWQHLDRMAACKMNVFHWHLSDDQGWRLPIPEWPKLTTVGAWRYGAEPDGNSKLYGGFYTRGEIQSLVAHARHLHITVVPEIDMPGHMSAAIAAYPELASDSAKATKPRAPLTEWGTFNNLLCPAKETTFQFVDQVLDELCVLFPDPWIHMGGDEVEDVSAWDNSPECQQKMKELGYTDSKQLENYFIARVEQEILKRGKVPVAWADAVPALSQTGTVLQFWSRYRTVLEGRTRGFRFILSPADYTYLDMNQKEDEPLLWAGYVSLSKAYSIDPSLWNIDDSKVLGIEAPLWTEFTPSLYAVDQHIWPRLTALAEAGWTPKNLRSLPDFMERLNGIADATELPKLMPPALPKNRITF